MILYILLCRLNIKHVEGAMNVRLFLGTIGIAAKSTKGSEEEEVGAPTLVLWVQEEESGAYPCSLSAPTLVLWEQ